MEKKNIDFLKDKNTQDIFSHIFQGAFGNPIAFNSAPTLADMDSNTWGYNSTNLYIKFNDGTGIVIAGVAMT